jgi:hypothetical protein
MTDYPRDRVGRRNARQAIVEEAVERARHDARFVGLSINCEGDMKYGIPLTSHRCRNDGSRCLCECHDPVEKSKP